MNSETFTSREWHLVQKSFEYGLSDGMGPSMDEWHGFVSDLIETSPKSNEPALLEALTDISETDVGIGIYEDPVHIIQELVDVARAAIAKAKGEAC